MPPTHVAFDMTPALVSGAGIGRYARDLARALDDHEAVELELMQAYDNPPSGRLERIAQGLGREALYYPLTLGLRARRCGAGVVHCPAPYGARTGGVPLVLSAHDVFPLRHPELFTAPMRWHMRHVSARHIRRASRVICGSEHTRRELIELVAAPPERVRIAPYGVDERFSPVEPDRDRLRERFGIAGCYVLCVGTLEPRKNLSKALEAHRRLCERGCDCTLVVVGGRGWRNEAFERELAASPGGVVLTGHVDDGELAALYVGAACLLFPSLGEGVGLPVLEAMASGTPVVSSDRTSLPEVVGDAGLLVDPTDADAIATAVMQLLQDESLAQTLRERGLRRSAARTWAACAEATVAVYREAIDESA